jgi:hypothetical protein
LEDLEATLFELRHAAIRGSETQIDDCLRALEGQVGYVRHEFGRKRGGAATRASLGGSVQVIRGGTTSEKGESDAS